MPVAQLGLDELSSVGGGDGPAVYKGMCHPRWTRGPGTAEGLRVFRVSFAPPDCQFFILYSSQPLDGPVRLLCRQVFRSFPCVIFICLQSEFSITEGKASLSP